MGTGNEFKSDLYALYNAVQNTAITHPKEHIIETLKEFFSQDSYYHYQRDQFGFPKTPDHTDLPLDAGLHDSRTTRVFIGEPYRTDIIYYPALLVKHGGLRSHNISLNRERGSVQYEAIKYIDGYGNETTISTPSHFIKAGAWEGSVIIDVVAGSPRTRDELGELCGILFEDLRREELVNSGIVIKSLNISGPSEEEDRNGRLYKCSITLDIYSEWRRHIPINSVVDVISICVDIGNLQTEPAILAENLRISTSIELIDALAEL